MKYLGILMMMMMGLASCSPDRTVDVGKKTTMLVEAEHNAGEVIKGEMITANIKVENTGDYPLVISDVNGSCSCTVVDKPEEPILPGEIAEIRAHVNTDKTNTGIINKQIRIVANTDDSPVTVRIIANVNPN